MTAQQWHARTVDQRLGRARAAAERDDFAKALTWLAMAETVEGELQPDWDRARESWLESAVAAARRRYAKGVSP